MGRGVSKDEVKLGRRSGNRLEHRSDRPGSDRAIFLDDDSRGGPDRDAFRRRRHSRNHDSGSTVQQSLRRGELLRLIREAGREPLERDTLYRPVQRTEATFTVLV